MKLRIEVQPGLEENEILIRCAEADENVRRIQQCILDDVQSAPRIVFYKQSREYYFPLTEILFFETEGDTVYAHTAEDSYKIRHRLYELMRVLPRNFVRASKSSILNTDRIHAITRNLTSSSLVEFPGTHKHVYVSRRYFAALRDQLEKRSFL